MEKSNIKYSVLCNVDTDKIVVKSINNEVLSEGTSLADVELDAKKKLSEIEKIDSNDINKDITSYYDADLTSMIVSSELLEYKKLLISKIEELKKVNEGLINEDTCILSEENIKSIKSAIKIIDKIESIIK